MINTHDSEVLVKVDTLKYLNIKIKEKTLEISFTSLNIKDKVKS